MKDRVEIYKTIRERYESSNDTLTSICKEYEIPYKTVSKVKVKENWTRKEQGSPKAEIEVHPVVANTPQFIPMNGNSSQIPSQALVFNATEPLGLSVGDTARDIHKRVQDALNAKDTKGNPVHVSANDLDKYVSALEKLQKIYGSTGSNLGTEVDDIEEMLNE